MRLRIALPLVVSFGVAISLLAQTRSTSPGRAPSTPPPSFFSGRVVMEDGSLPPERVVIERVCSGIPRRETTSDAEGNFSFRLGQESNILPDATSSRTYTNSGLSLDPAATSGRFAGCELRAALNGYRSTSINLDQIASFDKGEVGTILLQPLARSQGSTVSASTDQAPKDALKAYEQGRQALAKNNLSEAQSKLSKAVEIYPKFAIAWSELGRVHQMQNHFDEARKALAQSFAADDKYVPPYIVLAQVAAKQNNWEEVVAVTDRAIALDSLDFPLAFFYNAVAHFNIGDLDPAEQSARRGLRIDPQRKVPTLELILASILQQKNRYAESAEHFRAYLNLAPNAPNAGSIRSQLAEVEKHLANASTPTPK